MIEATTLQRLVQLRSLLVHALDEAKDETRMGRQRALILLDGACEYAVGLAIDACNLSLARDFEGNVQKVAQALDGEWDQAGRQGVRELHRARNLVQHLGTAPDQAEMPRWARDADRFTRGLVRAVFDNELGDVSLAAAVEDHELRSSLEASEQALEQAETTKATKLLFKAFDSARDKWRAERSSVVRGKPRPISSQDPTAKDVRASVDEMEALAEVMPFAADLGEYIWLRSIRNDHFQGIETPEDDVRRAFVFVLDWILRWEAFSSRFVADRRNRFRAEVLPPSTGEGHAEPVIIDTQVEVRDRWRPDEQIWLEVGVQLADVPTSGGASWTDSLQKALNSQPKDEDEEWKRASVGRDGLVYFRNVPADLGPDAVIALLETAMTQANIDFVSRAKAYELWLETSGPALDAYEEALSPLELGGSKVFERPRAHPPYDESNDAFVVMVPFTDALDARDHDVWEAFRDAADGDLGPGGWLDLDGQYQLLRFTSDRTPAEVAAVATEAIRLVIKRREESITQRAEEDEARKRFEDQLATRVKPRRLGGSESGP